MLLFGAQGGEDKYHQNREKEKHITRSLQVNIQIESAHTNGRMMIIAAKRVSRIVMGSLLSPSLQSLIGRWPPGGGPTGCLLFREVTVICRDHDD
jgi:hypothetical protein